MHEYRYFYISMCVCALFILILKFIIIFFLIHILPDVNDYMIFLLGWLKKTRSFRRVKYIMCAFRWLSRVCRRSSSSSLAAAFSTYTYSIQFTHSTYYIIQYTYPYNKCLRVAVVSNAPMYMCIICIRLLQVKVLYIIIVNVLEREHIVYIIILNILYIMRTSCAHLP